MHHQNFERVVGLAVSLLIEGLQLYSKSALKFNLDTDNNLLVSIN
jgi:hypothetical protein